MKSLLPALLVVLALQLGARACAWEPPEVMGVHAVSAHLGSASRTPEGGYNNVNPGIYMRWSSGLTLGAFYNSVYEPSVYGGWTITDGQDRFALTLGVMSGYGRIVRGPTDHVARRCRGSACKMVYIEEMWAPLVAPSIRLPFLEDQGARLSVIIRMGAPVVHLSIEHRFAP